MIIFLIIYFLFLFAYLAFNAYALLRVWSLRLAGDKTQLIVMIYLIVMVGLIITSILVVSTLSWQTNFSNLLRMGG